MPLTPADVHNVGFQKPPIGKRGYSEDDVDAFLDLVETELAALLEENADLRQRVGELETELAEARAGVVPIAVAPVYQPESVSAAVSEEGVDDDALESIRLLSLAKETASRLTTGARSEAEKILGDAQSNADQMISEARTIAETSVMEARQRADSLLSDASTQSEAQLRQAREKADILQADAERKHAEVMGNINQQRTVLEGRLEQLRTFEREYRTRLKTYLESQLDELGQRGSAAPADTGDVGFSNQ